MDILAGNSWAQESFKSLVLITSSESDKVKRLNNSAEFSQADK
jgi:hypothetical protein